MEISHAKPAFFWKMTPTHRTLKNEGSPQNISPPPTLLTFAKESKP